VPDDAVPRIPVAARSRGSARSHTTPGPDRTCFGPVLFTTVGPRYVIDAPAWLGDEANDGRRLAAYVYLRTFPDAELLDLLADAALEGKTRFGQYWALRALRRNIESKATDFDRNKRRSLKTLLQDGTVSRTSDRGREIQEILRLTE
jgi:hypothetical protein